MVFFARGETERIGEIMCKFSRNLLMLESQNGGESSVQYRLATKTLNEDKKKRGKFHEWRWRTCLFLRPISPKLFQPLYQHHYSKNTKDSAGR